MEWLWSTCPLWFSLWTLNLWCPSRACLAYHDGSCAIKYPFVVPGGYRTAVTSSPRSAWTPSTTSLSSTAATPSRTARMPAPRAWTRQSRSTRSRSSSWTPESDRVLPSKRSWNKPVKICDKLPFFFFFGLCVVVSTWRIIPRLGPPHWCSHLCQVEVV